MTEREPVNNNINPNELTNQANLPRLSREGGISMSEPGQQEAADNLMSPNGMGNNENAETSQDEQSAEEILRERYKKQEHDKDAVASFQENYINGIKKITDATSLDEEIKEELAIFIYYAEKAESVSSELDYAQTLKQIKELKKSGDLKGIQKIIGEFSKKINSHYKTRESVMPDIPESLEDLAAFIMKSEGEKWKTGGEKELLTAEGKVVKENFLSWVRKRIIEVHEFNPTSTVSFFEQITVRSKWSQISLYEMVLTGSYFLEKRKEEVIVPNPEGIISDTEGQRERGITTLHKNEDYEALRQQLLTETFLFNQSRNSHVEYIAAQFTEKTLVETLDKIYTPNTFTRKNFLEFIMSMPSMKYKEGEHAEKGKEIQAKVEKNFDVGQSARRLLLAYYYIHDYEMLRKLFPAGKGEEDFALFTKIYDKINPKGTGTDKDIGTGMEGSKNVLIVEGVKKNGREGWYDDKGRLRTNDRKTMEEYKKFINVFTAPGPQKSEEIIDEVRERMVRSIMKQMGIDYDEAKYAEAWAFSMTKWTGLAAKEDTAAIGHDAWTKVLNTQDYRIGQMADERSAMYGNIFNMLGIKRLGLNFFEGIQDENKRSIIEVLQGGQGEDVNLEKALKQLDIKVTFAENTMRGFAGNHIANSFALLGFLIDHDGFNFQNMLTFDALGRPVIDYEKANKVIGGVQKAIRYAYSTWTGIDYSKNVRTWEKESVIDENKKKDYKEGESPYIDKVVPKNMRILEEMFGKEIIDFLENQADRIYDEDLSKMTDDARGKALKAELGWEQQQEKIFNRIQDRDRKGSRRILWKGVFDYLIKAEIESHRNIYSDQERFNMLKMEAIYSYLQQKNIFTKEEMDELRKMTHTTQFGMLLQEGGAGALFGGLKGALKGLKSTTGALVK